ncbi:hypothetical protein, partial [Staphylococcus haemolyticus]|uniref:hypothetical protein n=1 Tax=Staphylococcus haemolyticus TaxID=1283 RepID=UPI002B24F358
HARALDCRAIDLLFRRQRSLQWFDQFALPARWLFAEINFPFKYPRLLQTFERGAILARLRSTSIFGSHVFIGGI